MERGAWPPSFQFSSPPRQDLSSPSPYRPLSVRRNQPHAPPLANGIPLLSPRHVLPDRFRTVFPFELFNAVQSKCFSVIYETSDNVVISAPTGSGKTALLELAICKLASQQSSENAKVVYLAPTKALCKEKAEQWRKTFGVMSMPISELTGDTSRAEMRSVREAKVIVTTPEKWDSITRSWADHRKLLDLVQLFLIDEVHILKESRGATLEAVVSRMKTYGGKVRFIALSATVPNSEDIASWLGQNHANPRAPSCRQVFGEEFRPVTLEKRVYGIDAKLSDHAFDAFLNRLLWQYLEKHSQKKPILVFCMTRKSCRDAAEQLAREWSQRQPSARLWPEPERRVPVIDASLQELVRYGVAFHHAGLDPDDRKAVHEAFLEGNVSVICCTSTLAVGVNLPCHTVLLKGTVCYQDNQLCEYSDLEVMQMLGRAGRPQFGNSAVAIILTRPRNKNRYEELGSGRHVLESTLHKNLVEHLNSEISLETFKDSRGAKDWLSGTFLSVRLRRNPRFYGDLTAGATENTIDAQLEQICESAISSLRDARMIGGEADFHPTEYGRAMSKYMIKFDTMKRILNIPRGATTQDLLNALCEAAEFNDIRWQANEREIFRDINIDPFIKYPIGKHVNTIANKVSLLIQMELGHIDLKVTMPERQRLRGEANRVLEVMHRLIRAVVECKGVDLDGKACWVALELARSMTAKAWEGKTMQLFQVPQLGPVLMRKLVSNNIKTVASLANSDAGTIERIASRNPPFGKKMKDSLMPFPRLAIKAKIKNIHIDADGQPVVYVDAVLSFTNMRGKWQGKIPLVTFLAVTTEGVSAYFWRDSLNVFKEEDGNSCHVCFSWSPEDANERLVCRFTCEEIVGTVVSVELGHDVPASALPLRSRRLPRLPAEASVGTKRAASDQLINDEDIEDDELLDLMNGTATGHVEAGGDDLFHLVDRDGDFVEQPSRVPTATQSTGKENATSATEQPMKLPNGRYKCGHPCSQAGGGKTARGDDCGHECCRNGSKKPPRKRDGNGKRGPLDDEATVASIGSTLDQSNLNPAPKRKKAKNTTSSTKLSPPVSKPTGQLEQTTLSRSRKTIDLSVYDIDDEGMIDLTMDDELPQPQSDVLADITRSGKHNSAATGRMREQASHEDARAEDLFDSLSDVDFMDVRVIDEGFLARQKALSKEQSKSTDKYVNEAANPYMVEEIQFDGQRRTASGDRHVSGHLRTLRAGTSNTFSHLLGSPSTTHVSDQDLVSSTQLGDILSDETLINETDGHGRVSECLGDKAGQAHSIKGKITSRGKGIDFSDGIEQPLNWDRAGPDFSDPSDRGVEGSNTEQKSADEPDWLREFDPDFVDEFRNIVDFV